MAGWILTNKWIKGLMWKTGSARAWNAKTGLVSRGKGSPFHNPHQAPDRHARANCGGRIHRWRDTWKAGLTLFETNYATTEPPKYAVAGGNASRLCIPE